MSVPEPPALLYMYLLRRGGGHAAPAARSRGERGGLRGPTCGSLTELLYGVHDHFRQPLASLRAARCDIGSAGTTGRPMTTRA